MSTVAEYLMLVNKCKLMTQEGEVLEGSCGYKVAKHPFAALCSNAVQS